MNRWSNACASWILQILVVLIGYAQGMAAQEVSVGLSVQEWDQDELRRVPAGELRLTLGAGVELAFSVGVRAWSETGIPCGGFIVEPCPEERLDVRALSFGASIGYEINVFTADGGAILLVPQLGLGGVDYTRRGQSSNRSVQDPLVLGLLGGAARYERAVGWLGGRSLQLEYRFAHGLDLEGACEDCANYLRGPSVLQVLTLGLEL